MINPYYLISLSGAYDSQDFWQKNRSESSVENLLEGASNSSENSSKRESTQSCVRIDCSDVSGSLYFCSDEAREELTKRIEKVSVNALHFIDSGDYHYLSLLFLQKINQPFTLLLFDHHSDCMESAFGGGLLTCGSWVLRSLSELPNLKKAVLVGPADEDGTGEILKSDSRILWVTEEEFERKREELYKELTSSPVYISFDKDVLRKEDALTDWSQGTMSVDTILDFLAEAQHTGAVFLGMDVCGEQKVGDEAQTNSDTNWKILKFSEKLLTGCL